MLFLDCRLPASEKRQYPAEGGRSIVASGLIGSSGSDFRDYVSGVTGLGFGVWKTLWKLFQAPLGFAL